MENISKNSSERKPRADVVRNRERILDVAREAFAGEGANVTLDDIVRLSGLGVGTLYRHFPTREALIQALYLAEIERLAASVGELSDMYSPLEALRQWLLSFVDLLATKHVMQEIMNFIVCDSSKCYTSGGLIHSAISTLTERAIESGEIKMDLEPVTLLQALTGVAYASTGKTWKVKGQKLVDVLIAGMTV